MKLFSKAPSLQTAFCFFLSGCFALALSTIAYGQDVIRGKVVSGDSVNVQVYAIAPADFPEVEVLFRAENHLGYPYWGLEKSDLSVLEDNTFCNVVSLDHLSKHEPIQIVLIIDHSGSMASSMTDGLQFFDGDTLQYYKEANNYMKEIGTPLGHAKDALSEFLQNFDFEKDSVGLLGFASRVDLLIEPTNEAALLKKSIRSLEADGGTAYYDALFEALDGLEKKQGIRAVISLTDGHDTESQHRTSEVIARAKEINVPLYCIGLGDVQMDTLQMLADSTDGYFAHTANSIALDSVYGIINKHLQAYYLLTYRSENWASEDVTRTTELHFEVEDLFVDGNQKAFDLPDTVAAYLKEREQNAFLDNLWMYGGVAVGIIVLLALGRVLLKRSSKKRVQILQLFPNPGNGQFTLEVILPEGITTAKFEVISQRGSIRFTDSIIAGSRTFHLNALPRGVYTIQITALGCAPASRSYAKL